MKSFSEEELAVVTTALEKARDYFQEKEALTEQVRDLLDLLITSDGNRLITLGEWHHSPALESEIIGWLEGTLETEGEHRARHRKILTDGDRPVEVRAYHMLDDYWQVTTFGFVFHEAGAEVPELRDGYHDRKTSMAVARIAGGRSGVISRQG